MSCADIRSCFGLNMLTTLPLEAFVCREVMVNYWFPDERWNPIRHLIFTTSLVFAAMCMALLTCDLGAVFELIGATSACALAYILPPLCYIKLSKRSWKTVAALTCVVFGVTVLSISLMQAVAKMIKSKAIRLLCSLSLFLFSSFLLFTSLFSPSPRWLLKFDCKQMRAESEAASDVR